MFQHVSRQFYFYTRLVSFMRKLVNKNSRMFRNLILKVLKIRKAPFLTGRLVVQNSDTLNTEYLIFIFQVAKERGMEQQAMSDPIHDQVRIDSK